MTTAALLASFCMLVVAAVASIDLAWIPAPTNIYTELERTCEQQCRARYRKTKCNPYRPLPANQCKCLIKDGLEEMFPEKKDCLIKRGSPWVAELKRLKSLIDPEIDNGCGISLDQSDFWRSLNAGKFKITEGPKAERLQFPWTVRVDRPEWHIDGKYHRWGNGVLIGDRILLTAKHVVNDSSHDHRPGGIIRRDLQYSGGDVDFAKNERFGRMAGDKNIFLHPDPDVDLAIVELKSKIEHTNPICLPDKNQVLPPSNYPYRAAGWGRTYDEDEPNELTYLDLEWHDDAWNSRSGLEIDAECNKNNGKYICSRYAQNSPAVLNNVCRGDSGSGWQYKKKGTDHWYLMGILANVEDASSCTGVPTSWGQWVNIVKQLDWICNVTKIGC